MRLLAVELNVCSDRITLALPVDSITDDQNRYIVIKSLLSSEMQCAFVF